MINDFIVLETQYKNSLVINDEKVEYDLIIDVVS